MKNNQVDIPLVFFFLAFCIVMFGLFTKISTPYKTESTNQKIAIPAQKIEKKKIISSIDYNKPISCQYETKEASISAYMEGSSIGAKILINGEKQMYVLQGDCLYSWIGKASLGTKKCEMGGYIPLGKQLLGSGLGSLDSIIDMFQQSKKSPIGDLKAVVESCKNVPTIEKDVFLLPKGVVFK